MTKPKPPPPTGYQPFLPEVTEDEALILFMHHTTCAAAYFELTELEPKAIIDHIASRFMAGTVEHRALTAFTHLLDYIYGD